MTLQQFIEKWNGKKADFDGAYGAQCFDLFQFYNKEVVGGGFVSGNAAYDIWTTYPKDLYTQELNTPTGVPPKGAVMIWGKGYGPYGHVAIVTGANVDTFTCLSQNDPTGRETHLKTYSDYKGVIGWLIPKKNVLEDITNTDLALCRTNLEEKTKLETELRDVITKKDIEIGELKATLANLNSTIEAKNRQIADLEGSSKQLAEQLKDCQFSLQSKTEQASKLPECENLTLEQEKKINLLKDEIESKNRAIAQYKSRWEMMKWSLKKIIVEKVLPLLT